MNQGIRLRSSAIVVPYSTYLGKVSILFSYWFNLTLFFPCSHTYSKFRASAVEKNKLLIFPPSSQGSIYQFTYSRIDWF